MHVTTPWGTLHDRRHGQGRRDDRAQPGDDARVPDHRRLRRSRDPRSRPAGSRRATRSTQSPWTANRRPTTRSSCWPTARAASVWTKRRTRRSWPASTSSARGWRARSCAAAKALRSWSPCASPAPRRREDARHAARLIANSPLVKTALNGGDPNWGRLVAVAGRAGVAFDPGPDGRTDRPAPPSTTARRYSPHREREAAAHLQGHEVEVTVDLGVGGAGAATMWTCDFSAEYVHINADYRT